jgi:4-amino-4-deoxy-L-arabinose transferase
MSAFLFRLTIAMSDQFLYEWDEQFHALVARHMMDHPFIPVLRTFPALPYDYRAWSCNYYWVHKQPLSLWQMALSMKIFGINFFGLRFPSMLMGTLSVLLIYKIAKIWTAAISIAWVAAALFAVSNYSIEIGTGYYGSDHVEVAYYFYELAAIWALCEYYISTGSKRQYLFIFLTGLFAGSAVLNLWLVALLVYGGWGLLLITDSSKNKEPYRYLHIAYSLAVCAMVFLPWQLYILHRFPLESHWEYEFNQRHITQALDGHSGTNWYYLQYLPVHYGYVLPFLILPGVIFSMIRKGYLRQLSIAMCAMYFVIYLFFSLLVLTRMHSFVFVVAPIGYILISISFIELINRSVNRWPQIAHYKLLAIIPLLILGYDSLRPKELVNVRSNDDPYRKSAMERTALYRSISAQLPDSCVLFACPEYNDMQLMFWNPVGAYGGFPSEKDLQTVLSEGYKVAVFNKCEGNEMPVYIANDSRVIKVVVNLPISNLKANEK